MSDLMSGFTEDGAPAAENPDSFEHQLAAAAAGSKEPVEATGASPSTPADPALSTGQQIVESLLDPSADANVGNGITVKDDETPAPPSDAVTLSDGQTYAANEVDHAILQAAANEEKLADLLDFTAGEQFERDVSDAEFDTDLTSALGELAWKYVNGEVSSEVYDFYRDQTIEELAPTYFEPNDEGEYEPAQLEGLGQMVDASVRQYATERHVAELDEAMPELVSKAADQRLTEIRAVYTQFAKNQGITDRGELQARMMAAEEASLEQTGLTMGEWASQIGTTPEQLLAHLEEMDGQNMVAAREVKHQAFKQSLLDSSPGSLEEGLSFGGAPPVVQHRLPEPSPERLSAKVQRRVDRSALTKDSIEASFAGPNFADGYTLNGKPVEKISEIDGSVEQVRRDEQWRRDRTRF
jgi:hypothetical protein